MNDSALKQTDNLYFKILLIVFLVFAIGLKLNILIKSDIILPDEAAIILGAQGLKNTALYFFERPQTPFKTYIEEKGGYIHKTAKPFYVFFLSVVMLIFGDSLLISKLVPLILSFINAVLVYKLLRLRQDSIVAWSGAITFLLMPYMLVYGSASLYTSYIWLFVLAGAYCLLKRRHFISGVLFSFSFLSHYNVLPTVLAVYAFFFVMLLKKEYSIKKILYFTLGFLIPLFITQGIFLISIKYLNNIAPNYKILPYFSQVIKQFTGEQGFVYRNSFLWNFYFIYLSGKILMPLFFIFALFIAFTKHIKEEFNIFFVILFATNFLFYSIVTLKVPRSLLIVAVSLVLIFYGNFKEYFGRKFVYAIIVLVAANLILSLSDLKYSAVYSKGERLLSNKPHISLYPKLSWLYNSRKIVSNVDLIYADEQNTNGIKFVIFDNYNARYDRKRISGILTKLHFMPYSEYEIHFPNILLFDLYHTTSDFKKKIEIYKRQ